MTATKPDKAAILNEVVKTVSLTLIGILSHPHLICFFDLQITMGYLIQFTKKYFLFNFVVVVVDVISNLIIHSLHQ